jgi:hypothetical protein
VNKPSLGKLLRGGRGELKINVKELLVGRCALCADSGAGKSWALRRLLEQLFGHALEWVIDIEGEFASLREIGDFTIVGGEHADIPVPRLPSGVGVQEKYEAEVAHLVRDLLALNANVIFDLFDLPSAIDSATRARITKGVIHDPTKAGFVAAFFKALIDLPKKMWVPMIVAVDEAQALAPEDGGNHTPALVPMSNWGTLARKRGQCPIYATNSLSEIANSSIRGFQNHLYGQQALDADNKRAAKNLGLDADGREEIARGLGKGEFICYGPALARQLVKVKVGPVRSTHPKPGEPLGVVPAPSEKVKKVLAALKKRVEALAANPLMTGVDYHDVPTDVLRRRLEAQHVNEARMAGLMVKLREERDALVKELEMARKRVVSKTIVQEVPVLTKKQEKILERLTKTLDGVAKKIAGLQAEAGAIGIAFGGVNKTVSTMTLRVHGAVGTGKTMPDLEAPAPAVKSSEDFAAELMQRHLVMGRDTVRTPTAKPAQVPPLERGEIEPKSRQLLQRLAQYSGFWGVLPRGFLCALVGGHPRSPGFTNRLGALKSAGLIDYERGGGVSITSQGRVGIPPPQPPRNIEENLQELVRGGDLEPKDVELLRAVIVKAPSPVSREALAEILGNHPRSPGFTNRLGALKTRDLIDYVRGGGVCATPYLVLRVEQPVEANG